MQEVVTSNDLGFRIREKGIRIARLATQIARHLGRIDTDSYRAAAVMTISSALEV